MSSSDDNSSAIVSRMRELRSTGQSDVEQLHAQVERVTDWREHVRAQPILAVVSSTAVGYLVLRALVGSGTPVQSVAITSPAQVANKTTASMGLLSLVGGIATSVGRQWVTEYLKKQLGVHAHAANQSTHSEQRSNASS